MYRYVKRRTVDPNSYPIIKEHWFGQPDNHCAPLELGLRDCKMHRSDWLSSEGTLQKQCNRMLDAVKWDADARSRVDHEPYSVNNETVTVSTTSPTSTNSATTMTTTRPMMNAGAKEYIGAGSVKESVSDARPITVLTATMTTTNLVCIFAGILVGLGGYGCYLVIMYRVVVQERGHVGCTTGVTSFSETWPVEEQFSCMSFHSDGYDDLPS